MSATPLPAAITVGHPLGSPEVRGEHRVKFYSNDEALVAAIVRFVDSAVADGEPIVLICTDSHRSALVEHLRATGVAVGELIDSGRLVLLDAKDTLNRLLRDGQPDRERFQAVVGGLFERLMASFPRAKVRAYGEMVDLLWRDGNPIAALHLEELWNGLQTQHRFSLLCAYAMANFYREPHAFEAVCKQHSHVVPAGAANPAEQIRQLEEIEGAMRGSLKELRNREAHLRTIADALPALVSYIDTQLIYRFTNLAYARWFGETRETLVGQTMGEVLGPEAVKTLQPWINGVLRGETVSFQSAVPYLQGTRVVEATYSPDFAPDGSVQGFIALVNDVTDRKRYEESLETVSRRSRRLLQVTAAIAEAVTAEQVFAAIVDQVSASFNASSAGLWVISEGHETASLVRATGYSQQAQEKMAHLSLERAGVMPVLDAMIRQQPVFIQSQQELLAQYPHLSQIVSPARDYRIAAIPLLVQGRAIGAIAFTFDGAPLLDEEAKNVMQLVARYSAQAVARLKMFEAEQRMRAQNEQARVRAELLYDLARAVISAATVDDVFTAALDGIERALGATRSSILAYGEEPVMRFKAWRGLSDAYRKAVDGHSPWAKDAKDPQPLIVLDVEADASMEPFRPLLRSEGIGALSFFPLVAGGRLLGKFMVYYDAPRALSASELAMARAIANHLATALARFQAIDALQQTVRFNELFTGMLGHDLRNPLGAIMTAAQVALNRVEGERLTKPLDRIISSGGRMARMIDQLLDFTRVRVGHGIPLVRHPMVLSVMLEQVIDELRARGGTIEVTADGEARGDWDIDRLSQVFSNLIANALQHGAAGTPVRVRVESADPSQVRVEVSNGGTIDPAVFGRLFEPMTGQTRRRDKSEGLGLGLYITREIVRAHGGEITVSTSPGFGTTFTVALPRAGAPA